MTQNFSQCTYTTRSLGWEICSYEACQPSERLASVGIMGYQLGQHLKPLEYHGSLVSRRLSGDLNWALSSDSDPKTDTLGGASRHYGVLIESSP